jgi:DNA replication ATP-dependent helicase Dna2
MTAGSGASTQISVTSVHSIEDKIWSTIWGVKGIVDVTVDVSVGEVPTGPRGVPGHGRLVKGRLPLELKTGRMSTGNVAHRAQVALYALLMADRRYHIAARGSDDTSSLHRVASVEGKCARSLSICC